MRNADSNNTYDDSIILPQANASLYREIKTSETETDLFFAMSDFCYGFFTDGRQMLSKLGYGEDLKEHFRGSWNLFCKDETTSYVQISFENERFEVIFSANDEFASYKFNFIFTSGDLEYEGNDYNNGQKILVGCLYKSGAENMYVWLERGEN